MANFEYLDKSGVQKLVENFNEKLTEYVKFTSFGEGRKTIMLDKRDSISSGGVNIGMVSDYEGLDFPVTELGGQKAAMVLNSNEQPVKVELTENGKRVQHVVATLDDFTPITEEYINGLFE